MWHRYDVTELQWCIRFGVRVVNIQMFITEVVKLGHFTIIYFLVKIYFFRYFDVEKDNKNIKVIFFMYKDITYGMRFDCRCCYSPPGNDLGFDHIT